MVKLPEHAGAKCVISRRQFLRGTAVAAAAFASLGTETIAIGTRRLTIERLEIRSSRIPLAFEGLAIVQLSDFHYDPFFNGPIIESAVREANELRPDVVVLTGDYVTQRRSHRAQPDPAGAQAAEPCAKLLSRLRSRLGTFAVLGNHDYFTDPDYIAGMLQAHNMRVLRNSRVSFESSGERVWLSGIEDALGGGDDLDQALNGIPTNEFTILLAHEPDYADRSSRHRVDVQLSGHSHGGQIRIPWLGAPYLPPLAEKYPWGLRRIGALTLYTNRGIGTIVLPARLNAPPEITLFTLRAGTGVQDGVGQSQGQ